MFIAKQILRFGAVGLLGTLAHYAILIVGVDVFGHSILISSSLGFLIGALINHHFNRSFTFSSEKTYSQTLIQFLISATSLFLLNLVLMHIFTSILTVQYLIAQFITTGAVFLAGFIISKLLIFKS